MKFKENLTWHEFMYEGRTLYLVVIFILIFLPLNCTESSWNDLHTWDESFLFVVTDVLLCYCCTDSDDIFAPKSCCVIMEWHTQRNGLFFCVTGLPLYVSYDDNTGWSWQWSVCHTQDIGVVYPHCGCVGVCWVSWMLRNPCCILHKYEASHLHSKSYGYKHYQQHWEMHFLDHMWSTLCHGKNPLFSVVCMCII